MRTEDNYMRKFIETHSSYLLLTSAAGGQNPLENYQFGKVIGQGAYAVVRLCLDKRNEGKYAMKIYDK